MVADWLASSLKDKAACCLRLVESVYPLLTGDTPVAPGDVKRRYQYGPTGEVLFDQVFDHAATTLLQAETDLLVPLGDHQHSTRVVLAHDANDATYVRQSLDYAQFGRVTATLGANGLADSTGMVTAYAHHGSVTDVATGLQLKSNGPGGRWYSPDLGRFVSEDPIQDGSNWYMASGNDPVNYADPSGLSQQGHPLATTTFGGFVGGGAASSILSGGLAPGASAGRGRPIQGLPSIAAPSAARPASTASFDVTSNKDLSSLTRTNARSPGSFPAPDPRLAAVTEGLRAQAFRDQMADFHRDYGPGGKKDLRKNRSYLDDPFRRDLVDLGSSVTPGVSDARDLKELATGRDAVSGQPLSWGGYGLTAVGAVLPVVGGSLLRRLVGSADTAHDIQRGLDVPSLNAQIQTPSSVGKYDVGPYNVMKGQISGLNAHHVGQQAVMKKLVPGYDPATAPSILVPKVGHTIKGPYGIVSRSTEGLNTARDVIARDIKELRRVYPEIPNSKLRDVIEMNKNLYPSVNK